MIRASGGTLLRKVGFISDSLFLEHVPPSAHPEQPRRLAAILSALAAGGIRKNTLDIPATDCPDEAVLRAHSFEHLASLKAASRKSSFMIDADTYFSDRSFLAAGRAAGAMLSAVEAVEAGNAQAVFAAVRPPGHHATRDRAMGFCLLNNAAIAARHIRSLGYERVFILDWDVHHGNGTQDIFYDDPSVFFFSIHQSPLYPGSGLKSEIGEGIGTGFTRNYPVSVGAGNTEFLDGVECAISEMADFQPDWLLISAGYDAHERDPLAECRVTSRGYGEMMSRVLEGAPDSCRDRLVVTLEGGYDLMALGESVSATIEAMLGGKT